MSRRTLARAGGAFAIQAIGLAPICYGIVPIALAAAELRGGATLSEASVFVLGALWIALGVVLWRQAPPPERRNLGTTQLTS